MKQFIISIIFLFSCVYGSPFINPDDIDPACWPELNNTALELFQCLNLERFDSKAIQLEVMTNLMNYSGDESALREFTEKYCIVGYELIDCVPKYFDITPVCQPIDTKFAHSIVRVLKRTWDFTCDNNAEAFVQLVINNGFNIIQDNYLLAAECGKGMDSLKSLINPDRFEENKPAIREKLGQVRDCHMEWMAIHGNSYLSNYVNGTYTITIEELGY